MHFGTSIESTKQLLQTYQPELYATLGLASKTSHNDIMFALHGHKNQLEETARDTITQTKARMKQAIALSTQEALQADKHKKNLLQFLHSIGFDRLNQQTTDTIINHMNLNPQQYGLKNKIEIANAELGFDEDFGDKALATAEKKAFIGLFNRIIGEDIIDENIATGTTSLSPEAVMRLQVLNNKMVGYFFGNLTNAH